MNVRRLFVGCLFFWLVVNASEAQNTRLKRFRDRPGKRQESSSKQEGTNQGGKQGGDRRYEIFIQLDVNKDGVIDSQESSALQNRPKILKKLQAFDSNGDGKIAIAEVQTKVMSRLKEKAQEAREKANEALGKMGDKNLPLETLEKFFSKFSPEPGFLNSFDQNADKSLGSTELAKLEPFLLPLLFNKKVKRLEALIGQKPSTQSDSKMKAMGQTMDKNWDDLVSQDELLGFLEETLGKDAREVFSGNRVSPSTQIAAKQASPAKAEPGLNTASAQPVTPPSPAQTDEKGSPKLTDTGTQGKQSQSNSPSAPSKPSSFIISAGAHESSSPSAETEDPLNTLIKSDSTEDILW